MRARTVVALTLDGDDCMPNGPWAAKWTALAIGAGLTLALVECALAVDLPPAPSLPQLEATPEDFGGWYLRGDLGAGFETAPALKAAGNLIAPGVPGGALSPFAAASFSGASLSTAGTIDAGVGYVLNPWFRVDATLEYRFGARLRSSVAIEDPAPIGGGGPFYSAGHLSAGVSSIVALVNGYIDLGNYWGVTPFLGAGLGVADNALSGVSEQSVAVSRTSPAIPAVGVFSNASRTNFARALTAGFDFDIAPNLKLEASYRYLNLGSIALGGLHCATGCGGAVAASSRGAFVSNDLRIGLIWLVPGPQLAPAPIVARY
jgi:opacity protein-like surface antigen